ncbi:phosphoribosylformylglycinamidine cyclo-ligase [bacterium]|nr:phosphoribosylformylglycinamidine cyclo-ligase [bacterium]
MALSYEAVGVDTEGVDSGLRRLAEWINATFAFNPARPMLPLGYYANVLPVGAELAVAISTDGVGTKLLIAQRLGRYDTVGIDCVAMNANDVICVGARPLSLVDYIAVHHVDGDALAAIAKGLHDGARLADLNIPGGEIAQLREMVHESEGYPFELVGTCIGTLHPQRLLIGAAVDAGDVVVGIASSGLHSNGYTLARHALLERAGLRLEGRIAELGRTLGEELLEPTTMYVRPAMAMLDAGLPVKALLHITGDGLLNLSRIAAPMGFVIDRPLPPPPIFALIQRAADVSEAEMYRTFNMGTGLGVVVPPAAAERAIGIAAEHGQRAQVIGYATPDAERRIWLPAAGLVGAGKRFLPLDGPPPAA